MRVRHHFITALGAAMILAACQEPQKADVPLNQHTSMKTYNGTPITHKHDAVIDSLLELMTLEEKVGMLHGTSMFSTAGVLRLGVPELKMADGPLGVREEISRDSWAPL